ncbi:metallophosphoesterase [Roseobacter sp. CCS2]|uniref:metallophosphoesterase n=1 Tax=Roseobacter sp. CCS2 TaxID=391593 RepID=UPI0000F40248|nr:metallophosphoesterase [Roseobacter sp. CCS2]EBA13985.1 metallophosphoesterase [Roseobacter sp. CCS2]
MRQFLPRFLRKRGGERDQNRTTHNTLKPEQPFYAVGDIHGRLDLLDEVVFKINPDKDQPVIFLGDYVDRGPDAASTLERLFDMTTGRPDQFVCLMGNHERMMLDFIDDPLGRGGIWLRNGGVATLDSYGIKGLSAQTAPDDVVDVSHTLEQRLGPEMTAWLRDLPLSWNSGNMWCVHAAFDPAKAPTAQRKKTLLWGHADFLTTPRQDDLCVVHGHTTVDTPINRNSRIAVDTGAYRTGCLTAVYIAEDHCSFVQSLPKQT